MSLVRIHECSASFEAKHSLKTNATEKNWSWNMLPWSTEMGRKWWISLWQFHHDWKRSTDYLIMPTDLFGNGIPIMDIPGLQWVVWMLERFISSALLRQTLKTKARFKTTVLRNRIKNFDSLSMKNTRKLISRAQGQKANGKPWIAA